MSMKALIEEDSLLDSKWAVLALGGGGGGGVQNENGWGCLQG